MRKFYVLFILFLIITGPLSAQQHFYDFQKQGQDFAFDQAPFFANEKYLLLQGKHPDYGNALWVSDATANGTALLKDCSTDPNARYFDFIAIGRYTFFNVYSKTGRELWYTDGTPNGTKKYNQSTYNNSSNMGTFKGWLFYTYIINNNNYEVRRIDTTFSKDSLVGTYARSYNGHHSYFTTTDSFIYYNYDVNIYRVYKDLGTPKLFWQRSTTPGGDIIGLCSYKNALLWHMRGSSLRTKIYASKENLGTAKELTEVYGYENILDKVGVGDGLFFTRTQYIYMLNLTTLTLTELKSTATPFWCAGNGELEVYNNLVYFQGRHGAYFRTEIWSTNGTDAGTKLVSVIANDTIASLNRLHVANNTLFFNAYTNANGRELWSTKGTAGSTAMVSENLKGYRSGITGTYSPSAVFNNKLIFSGYTDETGNEPWITDGTANGTFLLKDINNTFSYGNQEVGSFMLAGDYLFIGANDSINGFELWRTDGTTGGTILVHNICPEFLPSEFGDHIEYRNKLFVTAFSLVEGNELYTSNGKTGTANSFFVTPSDIINSSSPHDYEIIEPYLYYLGSEGAFAGNNLFRSDGTKPGTAVLNKGVSNSYSKTEGLRKVGSLLYFSAQNPGKGTEPMVSNGTLAGTGILKEIATGTNSSDPAWFCGNDTVVFFSAKDASANFGLYRSNGTEQGTFKVFDLKQKDLQNIRPDTMFYMDGKVFMKAKYTGSKHPNVTMLSVWNIAADSFVILQPAIGDKYGNPSGLKIINNKVIFSGGASSSGFEPWITDGSIAGTFLLKDINIGTPASDPKHFAVYNGLVFFSAKDPVNGREAWVSDGTTTGTRLLWDIEPGTGNGNPVAFAGYKGYVYIAASQGARTQSLFRIKADSCNAMALRLRKTNLFNTMCDKGVATVFVESGFDNSNIKWYRNDTLLSFTSDTVKTSLPGIYHVEANNNNCHSISNAMPVIIQPAPVVIIKYVADSAFCEGGSLNLKQESINLLTYWYVNTVYKTTGTIFNTKAGGNVHATVTDAFGCTGTSNILKVTMNPKPFPAIIRRNDTLFSSIDVPGYQWFFNGSAVSTKKYFKLQGDGNYQIEATTDKGCKGVSAVYKYIKASVKPITNTGLLIYPNPVKDILTIDVQNIRSIRIVNMVGKVCIIMNGGAETLNLSGLNAGIYTVAMETDTGVVKGRFVKED